MQVVTAAGECAWGVGCSEEGCHTGLSVLSHSQD